MPAHACCWALPPLLPSPAQPASWRHARNRRRYRRRSRVLHAGGGSPICALGQHPERRSFLSAPRLSCCTRWCCPQLQILVASASVKKIPPHSVKVNKGFMASWPSVRRCVWRGLAPCRSLQNRWVSRLVIPSCHTVCRFQNRWVSRLVVLSPQVGVPSCRCVLSVLSSLVDGVEVVLPASNKLHKIIAYFKMQDFKSNQF